MSRARSDRGAERVPSDVSALERLILRSFRRGARRPNAASADGFRTNPSGPSTPRLQRAENRHDGPPCGTRQILPRLHDDRRVVFRGVSALCPLCSCYAPPESVLRPVLSDRCPASAHGANGNSFWLSDLRRVVTGFRPMLSGFGRRQLGACCGFDSRRLHHVAGATHFLCVVTFAKQSRSSNDSGSRRSAMHLASADRQR